MIDEAETVKRLHAQWMDEHRHAMRDSGRRLVCYLIYCGIVTFSSVILIVMPPAGLRPPEDFHMHGEMVFLLILFGSTIFALFALLAWLEFMMGRQAERAAALMATCFELGKQIGNRSPS